jgi:hypothetical protein
MPRESNGPTEVGTSTPATPSPAQFLEYLEDTITSLATLADDRKYGLVAYFLRMAALQAHDDLVRERMRSVPVLQIVR